MPSVKGRDRLTCPRAYADQTLPACGTSGHLKFMGSNSINAQVTLLIEKFLAVP